MLLTLRALALLGSIATLTSCATDRSLVPSALHAFDVRAAGRLDAVRVSEFHYDNAGNDVDEWIEIAGPTGTSLAGWSIVRYNGSDGRVYGSPGDSDGLADALPNTCNGQGVAILKFPPGGLQNGAPDGFALVDPNGSVVEFLSYEGSFTAVGPASATNPAGGMTSVDVGVGEPGNAAGTSIQRTATGGWILGAANFGACNDVASSDTPIESITLSPTTATLLAGRTQRLTAVALGAGGVEIPNAPLAWTSSDASVARVSATGLVTALDPGTATITAANVDGAVSASSFITVTEPEPLPASDVFISEIHYDNSGIDVNEAIEVEGPAGSSFAGWSVVLYNGNGGGSYGTIALPTEATSCPSGKLVVSVLAPGLQNGPPDGVALVNASGALIEFISYEGSFRASDGPAAGYRSTDIGIDENGSGSPTTSLQKDALGWFGPAPASFGACNVAPAPFISIFGRSNADPALPVGFEDQLFANYNDGRGNTVPGTFTWSSDTPAIATVDASGVMRAIAPGTAIMRATSPDGTSGTISLATITAVASQTAMYANHTEFGTPTDRDARDDYVVRYPQYTASFNRYRGIPNWVSYNLELTHFGAEDRCECFTFDPGLPRSFDRYTTADYTGAGDAAGYGIDRGHLVRSFDRTAGSLDNARTYYFTNIIPQASDNNQGPWSAMEIEIGDLARAQNKEVFVIAGASGSRGTVKNEGRITIPENVWKVVVVLPRDAGRSSVTSFRDAEIFAVIMPNVPGIRSVPWRNYLTTVNAVEKLSGYNVLSLLNERDESVIETGMKDVVTVVDALVAAASLTEAQGRMLNGLLVAGAINVERGRIKLTESGLTAVLTTIDKLVAAGHLQSGAADALRAALTKFFQQNGMQ